MCQIERKLTVVVRQTYEMNLRFKIIKTDFSGGKWKAQWSNAVFLNHWLSDSHWKSWEAYKLQISYFFLKYVGEIAKHVCPLEQTINFFSRFIANIAWKVGQISFLLPFLLISIISGHEPNKLSLGLEEFWSI